MNFRPLNEKLIQSKYSVLPAPETAQLLPACSMVFDDSFHQLQIPRHNSRDDLRVMFVYLCKQQRSESVISKHI